MASVQLPTKSSQSVMFDESQLELRTSASEVVALPDLLHPERLDALLLGLYGATLMPSHLPVLVSQWAKY